MPRPKVSTLKARSKSFMSYSVQADILQSLDTGLRRISSHLESSQIVDSNTEEIIPESRGSATVEYGRLLEDITALLFHANLEGLQRIILADQSYMEGESTEFIDLSEATPGYNKARIKELSARLLKLEQWVVSE